MKKTLTRLMTLLLSLTMVLGICAPAVVLADEPAIDAAFLEQALSESTLESFPDPGDIDPYELPEEIAIDVIKYIGGKIGGKIESEAWNNVWKAIFGSDGASKEIIDRLNRIERQLNEIQKKLDALDTMLAIQSIRDRLNYKRSAMQYAATPLNAVFSEFARKDATMAEKEAALDAFFHFSGPPIMPGDGEEASLANAFEYFAYYCRMVAGTGEYEKKGFFNIYDLMADMRWNFEVEGLPFRADQRNADIHFVSRMSVVLELWMQKERAKGENSEYINDLKRFDTYLRQGLKDLVVAVEKHPLPVRHDDIEFHWYKGKMRYSFELHKTGLHNVKLADYFKRSLQPGRTTHSARREMIEFILGERPTANSQLISQAEVNPMREVAKNRGQSLRELLKPFGFPTDKSPYMLLSTPSRLNRPLSFGSPTDLARWRWVYIENIDMTSRSFAGDAEVGKINICWTDQDEIGGEHWNDFGRRTRWFTETEFLPVYVRNVKSEPVDILDPDGDGTVPTIIATIDSVEGDVLTATTVDRGEDERPAGETGTLWLNGFDAADMVGKVARITFEDPNPGVEPDENRPEGTPRYRVTSIELETDADDVLIDDPVPAPQIAEGIVAHIHRGGDMPGGLGLLLLEIPGGTVSFLVPMGVDIGDDIINDARVRITYHTNDTGNVADVIELLDMPDPIDPVIPDDPIPGPVPNPDPVEPDAPIDPAPVPQWAEGQVTIVEIPDMPGQPIRFTVQADREFTFTLPYGMMLDEGVAQGALVHVDFHEERGDNLVDEIYLLTPAPNPTPDEPIYGPIDDDPIYGPLDGEDTVFGLMG